MSEYDQQAIDFAKKYGLKLSCSYIGFEHNPLWDNENKCDHWKCTLRSGNGSYTFDFWMGVGLNGRKPAMYDVLSAMQKYEPGSFEEFCREYGYNSNPLSDYPRVMSIYKGCLKEYAALHKLLPADSFEELYEIN